MSGQILGAIPCGINHLRIRVTGTLHTETSRVPKCPARGDVSPHFSAAIGGFFALSVIRSYTAVTCCTREACAIFGA